MDRRQKKTRRSIYQAFEALMAEQHYSQFTVAQIIERADIGRSTFYAHFETKDDLISQLCDDMFEVIFEGVNEQCVTHVDLQATDLQGVLAHLLYHMRDTYGAICGKLLIEGEPHFRAYFDKELQTLFARKSAPEEGVPSDLRLRMLSCSFCEALSWWFANGSQEDPERVAGWFLAAWHMDY